MRTSIIVEGTFCGAEIEPGTFHRQETAGVSGDTGPVLTDAAGNAAAAEGLQPEAREAR